MFLIDAIKPNLEKKFKTCFIFYATVTGGESEAYIFFLVRFVGGNNNIIQRKRETYLC